MIRLYEDEKDLLNKYWQYREESKDSLNRSLLGNFINIIISNLKTARNFTEYNSQYFSVLSRFASLGKEARLYLLKAKIVGRILNYYQGDSSAFHDYFNDFSDLNFEVNPTPEIGVPFKLENVRLSLWEELFVRKRDAQIAEANQDSTFLFETLSWCIRS